LRGSIFDSHGAYEQYKTYDNLLGLIKTTGSAALDLQKASYYHQIQQLPSGHLAKAAKDLKIHAISEVGKYFVDKFADRLLNTRISSSVGGAGGVAGGHQAAIQTITNRPTARPYVPENDEPRYLPLNKH